MIYELLAVSLDRHLQEQEIWKSSLDQNHLQLLRVGNLWCDMLHWYQWRHSWVDKSLYKSRDS